MLALVVAILIAFLGAAFAGATVAGLFWLTMVAFAGLLITGALAVSIVGRRAEDDAVAEWTAPVSELTARSRSRHRSGAHDGGALSRAA